MNVVHRFRWNDGLGLVADSAGLGWHVRLARWFDPTWASEREKISGYSKGETVRGVPENPNSPSLTNQRGARRCSHITPGLSDNVWSQTNLWVKRRSIRKVHKNNIEYETLKLAECEKYTGWMGGEQHMRRIKKLKSFPILLTPVFCNLCCCLMCVVRTYLYLIKTIYINHYKMVKCFAIYLRELHV